MTTMAILTRDELDHLACGAVAGGVARLFVAPLDLIKIRFQIQDGSSPAMYSSVRQSIRRILQTEGITAFWKGNLSAELMVVPYVSIQFAAFHLFRRRVSDHLPHLPVAIINLASGSVAGLTATACVYPLDLVRTRMAAQHVGRPSFLGTLQRAYLSGGPSALYHGLWPTLVGIVPYAALQFAFYGQLNSFGQRFIDEKNLYMLHFWSGFIAGIASKTLTMPFDVIKKRMQVAGYQWRLDQKMGENRVGNGVLKYGAEIVRNEGGKALFQGLSASLLKAAPNSAITFLTFELCRDLLRSYRQEPIA